jgi:hypothetical protein
MSLSRSRPGFKSRRGNHFFLPPVASARPGRLRRRCARGSDCACGSDCCGNLAIAAASAGRALRTKRVAARTSASARGLACSGLRARECGPKVLSCRRLAGAATRLNIHAPPPSWISSSIVVSISACHADDPGSNPGSRARLFLSAPPRHPGSEKPEPVPLPR